jgi:hypothetical protein
VPARTGSWYPRTWCPHAPVPGCTAGTTGGWAYDRTCAIVSGVIDVVKHRLRIRFSSRSGEPAEDDRASGGGSVETRDVEFVAYADDCRLFGHLRLAGDRLTDMLNEYEEYILVDVLAESLLDGRVVETPEVLVARDDLYAVEATGPRGNGGRRLRTRQHQIGLKLGPYLAQGYLHALPGVDPLASVRRRAPMVPLTHAWIGYASAGTKRLREATTLVVNREQTDWIVPASEESEVEFPDVPVATEQGPLLKDFTGQLLGELALDAS